MHYTLKTDPSNEKAMALLNYLKTLDFIELRLAEDTIEDALNQQEKLSIDRRLKDLKEERIHSHENVRKIIRSRIQNNSY